MPKCGALYAAEPESHGRLQRCFFAEHLSASPAPHPPWLLAGPNPGLCATLECERQLFPGAGDEESGPSPVCGRCGFSCHAPTPDEPRWVLGATLVCLGHRHPDTWGPGCAHSPAGGSPTHNPTHNPTQPGAGRVTEPLVGVTARYLSHIVGHLGGRFTCL